MKCTFIIFFSTIFVFLSATTFDFDLKKYRAKEYSYQAASLNFNSFGALQNRTMDSDYEYDNDAINYNLYLRPNYIFTHYKPHYFKHFKISTYHRLYSNISDKEISSMIGTAEQNSERELDYDTFTILNQIDADFQMDKYLWKEIFTGFAGYLYFNHLYRKYERDADEYESIAESYNENLKSSSESIQNFSAIEFEPRIKIGFGLIESVFPARKSVYILQDLEDAGLLAQNPEDSQIMDLANIINQIDKSRFLDKRDEKLYAMETILQFLADQKLISEQTPRVSAIVYDVWDSILTERFSSYIEKKISFERQSGFRNSFFIGMPMSFFRVTNNLEASSSTNSISVSDSISTYQKLNKNFRNDAESNSDLLGISCGLENEYANPFKLNWQFSANNTFLYQYSDYHSEEVSDLREIGDDYIYDIYPDSGIVVLEDTVTVTTDNTHEKLDRYQHEINNSLNFGVGYLYNIRTSFFARISCDYKISALKSQDLFSKNKANQLFDIVFSISSQYQFSKKLILNGDVYFSYQYLRENYPTIDDYNFSPTNDFGNVLGFNFGLNYLLF